jgi:signal transduction histidine kinase
MGMNRQDGTGIGPAGYLGLAVIWGSGLVMGSFGVAHALTSDVAPASLPYVLTPIIFNAGLLVSGFRLWRHQVEGRELLQIGGWVIVGIIVSGLLVTWTVTHQLIRGNSFSYDLFVTVNNLSFGALIGVILGWLDASNRRHERQLEAERDKLSQQNERLDEFAGIVSHDLRNPLNVATLHLQTARDDVAHESLDRVESALTRMEHIVEDVLTMAREGNQVEETERITLRELADASWRRLESDRATMTVQDDVAFQADRSQVEHVFENLFRNAVEHGLDSGDRSGNDPEDTDDEPALTISVGTCEGGFYVADDGVGIDETVHDSLFDSGFSTKDDGTGLGLSIVARMVRAHGWEIEVTESERGGARFEITGVEPAQRDATDIIDDTWEAVRTDD